MQFFITTLYGLLLTAGLVFSIVTAGRYVLYLFDKFEPWLRGENTSVDSTSKER